MKAATKLAIGSAAVVAGSMFGAPAGYAYGDAPWCAVTTLGKGDVYWDCQYQTAEECVPKVIAGDRGFCNLNPRPGLVAAAAPLKRHYKHHVRRD